MMRTWDIISLIDLFVKLKVAKELDNVALDQFLGGWDPHIQHVLNKTFHDRPTCFFFSQLLIDN